MPKTIIAEGKTTNEAVSKGLKELNATKEMVEIKVLENHEKRSFFSILEPRVVKVEITLKDNAENYRNNRNSKVVENDNWASKKEESFIKKETTPEDMEKAKKNVDTFLQDFANQFEDVHYEIVVDSEFLKIDMQGNDASKLIGYRGDILNSLQIIINAIANKNCESKVRVILNIGDYKEKREKALEELADKIARTVLKTGKSITLEPMVAYERKIIHNRLQSNNKIRTYSIGDEPYRKVVIAINK